MTTYTFKTMTTQEKTDLFYIVAPEEFHSEVEGKVFNEGLSMWKNDTTWWGGICFIENSNVLIGGFVPFAGKYRAMQESLNMGFWIRHWPEMIEWAHNIHEEIVFNIVNRKVADLLMKVGGYELTEVEQGYVVLFRKHHTEETIQNREW
jgi:hypothetical protein